MLRTAPCLLGCFSLVAVLFHRCHATPGRATRPAAYPWYVKTDVTFADALAAVRRLLWRETVFMDSRHDSPLKKLPFKLRDTLLDRLSCAA